MLRFLFAPGAPEIFQNPLEQFILRGLGQKPENTKIPYMGVGHPLLSPIVFFKGYGGFLALGVP